MCPHATIYVLLVAAGVLSLLVAMLLAAYFLLAIQCCTVDAAFASIKVLTKPLCCALNLSAADKTSLLLTKPLYCC